MARAKSIKGESTAAVTNSFVHGLLDRVSAHLRLSCPRGGPYRTCLSSIVTLSLGRLKQAYLSGERRPLASTEVVVSLDEGFREMGASHRIKAIGSARRKESASWTRAEGEQRKCGLLRTMNFAPVKHTTPL